MHVGRMVRSPVADARKLRIGHVGTCSCKGRDKFPRLCDRHDLVGVAMEEPGRYATQPTYEGTVHVARSGDGCFYTET